jgi:hypothetical protein
MVKAQSYNLDGIVVAKYKFATIEEAIKFGEEKLQITEWTEDENEMISYYNNSENHQEYFVIFK